VVLRIESVVCWGRDERTPGPTGCLVSRSLATRRGRDPRPGLSESVQWHLVSMVVLLQSRVCLRSGARAIAFKIRLFANWAPWAKDAVCDEGKKAAHCAAQTHCGNAGGHNQARAMLTGSLVGAQVGFSGIPMRFLEGLNSSEELVSLSIKLVRAKAV
jgi:hypothetical protein